MSLISDDFFASVLSGDWAVFGPSGTSTNLATSGEEAYLELTTSPGDHDVWTQNRSSRVLQAVADEDFDVVAKFLSTPTAQYQMQGILVEEDADSWIRFDTYSDGNTLYAFAAVTLDGFPTALINVAIPGGSAPYLNVTRSGDVWTFSYSTDGASWTVAGSFTQALNVTAIGPFAASTGAAPGFTAEVDYFFDATNLPAVEDGMSTDPNTAPIAVDDALATDTDTALTVNVANDLLANDSDPDGDSLSLVSFGPSANGTLTDEGNGTFTYQPNAGYTGTDTIAYTITDGQETASGSVSITVADPAGAIINEDFDVANLASHWLTGGPAGTSANLATAGDEAYLELTTSAGDHDVWTQNRSSHALQAVADEDFDVAARFLSTPTARFQMQGILVEEDADSWIRFDTYSDGYTLYAFAAVTSNGVPSAKINVAIPGGSAPFLNVTRSGDVWTFSYSTDGATWTVAGSFTQAFNVNAIGPFAASSGAAPGFTAEVDYFFDATNMPAVEDGMSTDPNTAPIAADDALATDTNTALIVNVANDLLANDSDPDGDAISLVSFGPSANGTLIDEGNGTFTYQPNAGYTGIDTIAYTITDGQETASGSVTITVADPPGAVINEYFDTANLSVQWMTGGPSGTSADLATIGSDAVLQLTTSPGDFDVWTQNRSSHALQAIADEDFDVVARFLSTPTAQYQMQGILVEEDADSWIRFDTFSDGNTLYAFASVTLDGGPSTKIQVAIPGGSAPFLNVTRSGDVWTFSYSTDGAAWTVAGSFAQAFNVNAIGPFAGSTGSAPGFTAEVDYFFDATNIPTIEDGQTLNLPPNAVDDALTVSQNSSITIDIAADLLANDSDPNGDPLELAAFSLPGNGTLIDNGDGTLSYTPNLGFSGTDTFTYDLTDGTISTAADVVITVEEVIASIATDDFSGAALGGHWTVAGPNGSIGALSNQGNQSFLELTTSNGDFELLGNNRSTRAIQQVENGDFGIAARFLSVADAPGQAQGLIVENDDDNWIALQGRMTLAGFELSALVTTNANTSTRLFAVLSPQEASHLRIDRFGDIWTFEYSADGQSWNSLGTISQNLAVSGVGTFAASESDGFTAQIDYFMDTAAPLVIEDGQALQAPPVAADDALSADAGEALTINVATDLLANDSDADGDTVTLASFEQPTNGTLIDNGDGTLTYTPDAGYFGPDSFTYAVTDGAETTTASVSIDVAEVNAAGIFSDEFDGSQLDPNWTFSGIAGSADVVSDAQADWLEIVSPQGVAVDAYNELTTPRVLQAVADGDFQISAGFLNEPQVSNQEHGLLIVQDDNNWLRFDVAYTTSALRLIVGVVNDGAPSLALFESISSGDVAHLRITRDGNLFTFESSQDGETWEVRHTLTSDIVPTEVGPFAGSVAFGAPVPGFTSQVDYFVSSDDPLTTPPVAMNDLVSTGADTPLTINVNADLIANDTDADGSVLSLVSFGQPAQGSLIDNGDGTLSYTPAQGFVGVDSFSYTINDDQAEASATAYIGVSEAGNTAPTGLTDSASTSEGTPVTVDVLANDSDADGDTLSIAGFSSGQNGQVSESPAGELVYTPDQDFSGNDSFTYFVTDGRGGVTTATVDVAVAAVNDSPVTSHDAAVVIAGTVLVINASDLLANDSDPEGDGLTLVSVSDPSRGTIQDNGDGTYSYTPDAGFIGLDGFIYTVSDGTTTSTGTVGITVEPAFGFVSDDFSGAIASPGWSLSGPVGTASTTQANGEGYLALTVPSGTHDVWGPINAPYYAQAVADKDFSLEVKFLTAPAVKTHMQGLLVKQDDANWLRFDTLYNGTEVIAFAASTEDGASATRIAIPIPAANAAYLRVTRDGDAWTFEHSADGIVWFEAGAFDAALTVNEVGPFAATAHDAQALEVQVDYVKITGDVLNDDSTVPAPPIAVDDLLSVAANTELTIDPDVDLLANDSDPNNDQISLDTVGAPANGTLADNGDGTYTYTPDTGFTGVDQFDYTITDGAENAAAVARIEVDNVAPTVVGETLEVDEDGSITFDPLLNDSDPNGDPIVLAAVSGGMNGTPTLNGDGTITYVPDADFFGMDTIDYVVSDGVRETAGQATIDVLPIDDVPIAGDDELLTAPGNVLVIDIAQDLLSNDVDVDGDPLSITSFGLPANGTVIDNGDGTATYTPDQGFEGTDSFSYTLTDGNQSVAANVDILVRDAIHVWYGTEQTFGANGDAQQWVNLLGNVVTTDLVGFSYSLNGGPVRNLSVGPDTRRLQNDGDFNIDINFDELDGSAVDDIVTISATRAGGQVDTRDVVINYESGTKWSPDYTVDWENVAELEDAVQVVDGLWQHDASGVRPVETGYDRVVTIGDQTWDNYEAAFSATFHDTDNQDPLGRDGGGFGFGMLWNGHGDTPFANWQPKVGWYDAAYFFNSTISPGYQELRAYGNWNNVLTAEPLVFTEGLTYEFRLSIEQVGALDRQYSYKAWETGTSEPVDWLIQTTQSFDEPTTGGLAFIAHYWDITFGDIQVSEIEGSDIVPGAATDDVILAVDTLDAAPGIGEFDVLIGGEGADQFILGQAGQVFYSDGDAQTTGDGDYALIWDLDKSVDQIHLAGASSDYRLDVAPSGTEDGVGIFLIESGGADELIGIVHNEDVQTLALTDSVFVYDMIV